VWSGWELTRPENSARKIWWWIFYVTLALGFLAKGPVAWLPLGGMILGRMLRKNSFACRCWKPVAGLCGHRAGGVLGNSRADADPRPVFAVGMGEHVCIAPTASLTATDSRALPVSSRCCRCIFDVFRELFSVVHARAGNALRRWWPERGRDELGWYLLTAGAAGVRGVFAGADQAAALHDAGVSVHRAVAGAVAATRTRKANSSGSANGGWWR
jgi:hypothetical protein